MSAERTSSTGLASDTVGLWGKTALPQGFSGGVDFALAYAFSWSRGVASRYGHEGAELKALASTALGPLVVHANAGARYVKAERTSKFVWALAAEQPRAMGLIDLGIESFGVAGEAAWVQAVLRWELVKDQWQVDASVGREVKHGVSRVFTVGLKASF